MSGQETVVYFTHFEGRLLGGERLLVDLANSLGSGCRVIIFVRKNGARFTELFDREVVVHEVDYECYPYTVIDNQRAKISSVAYARFMRWFFVQNLRLLPQVRRLLARESVDIVHSMSTVVAMGSLYSLFARKPHVWHASETLEHFGLPQRLWLAYMKRTSVRIVGVSERTARDYGSGAVVIKNGVQIERVLGAFDVADPTEISREFSIGEGEIVITCIGTIQPSKGQHVLVKSLSDLTTLQPAKRYRLFLVGPRVEHPPFAAFATDLVESIRAAGLEDRVHLTGYRADYLSFIKRADVCVHPVTQADSFPAAVRDPMICGRPVVASAIGGIPEMIDSGVSGILVSPNDPLELAHAINAITSDKAFTDCIVRNARERALAEFDAFRMAREVQELYSLILEST